jgi:hypothetical protein
MTAVKFVKGRKDMIEGPGIPFGGPLGGKDLDGEYFTKSTDLCLDWFDGSRPLLYHHGLDGAIQTDVIGRVKSYEVRDDGMWVQAQLDKASRYRQAVTQLIDEEALGFSSGTMSHLVTVDTKTGEIKRWPWVEESLTPTPSNPDAAVTYAVKTTDLVDHLTEIDVELPGPLIAVMKALDDWADRDNGSASESYTDQGQRVLADLQSFAERSKRRHDGRAADPHRSGKTLSIDDRVRLQALQSLVWSVSSDVDALLRLTDPTAATRAAEAQQLLAEFVEIESRLTVAGVSTPS